MTAISQTTTLKNDKYFKQKTTHTHTHTHALGADVWVWSLRLFSQLMKLILGTVETTKVLMFVFNKLWKP